MHLLLHRHGPFLLGVEKIHYSKLHDSLLTFWGCRTHIVSNSSADDSLLAATRDSVIVLHSGLVLHYSCSAYVNRAVLAFLMLAASQFRWCWFAFTIDISYLAWLMISIRTFLFLANHVAVLFTFSWG